MRRPGVVVGTAFITVLALLVALGLILFSVNPGVNHTEGEIKVAVMSQHAIICAQVQNTANSYRFRSLTPSGNVEPIRHFLTRMQAQQQTLRLARGSECKSAPGFPPVGLQVRRALRQIHEILQHFEPKLREPVSRGISRNSAGPSHKQGGFLSGIPRPPHAGIDESGVPVGLHGGLTPSAPLTHQKDQHRPPPVVIPAPEEPEPSGSPKAPIAEPSSPPGTNAIKVSGPKGLPINVEVNLESEGLDVKATP